MGTLIVIVILVFTIPNIIDYVSKQIEEGKEREKIRLEQEKIKHDYDALVKKYKESELTHRILKHICDGDYKKNFPEEIIVSYSSVRSNLNGCPHSFDFKKNRITELHHDENCHWSVSATEAMAEAINLIMGGKYRIYEKDGVAHMELEPIYDF